MLCLRIILSGSFTNTTIIEGLQSNRKLPLDSSISPPINRPEHASDPSNLDAKRQAFMAGDLRADPFYHQRIQLGKAQP